MVSGIASSTLATAMTTALPSLVVSFGVSTSVGQWVTSGYSLVMGMVMPLTAFSHNPLSHQKLYLSGIGLFLLGLLLSIFAGSFGFMMAGRVCQACGNGVLTAAAQVIILTIYPPEKRGTMMGTYGLATTAAPVIAPTVAGVMIDAFGWKSIFYLVLVIMAASFVLSGFVFENAGAPGQKSLTSFPSCKASLPLAASPLASGISPPPGSSASRRASLWWWALCSASSLSSVRAPWRSLSWI